MSSKDDALRRKKKQEKLSNELLGISNVEFEPKEKKKPQQEQFKKKCGRCNKTKLLHNFGEDKRFSDNLKSICNLCEIALEKEANSKIKNLDLKSSQSTKPKTTPTPNAVPKPESNQTEKIDNSTNANSSSDSSEGGFLVGLFAIGLVVGAIYLVVKIFGFGIDFVSSFFEESSEPTVVVNNTNPNSDTQITQTDFCLNWENEIETLQKAFLSGESDLTIELNIYKTCFNNQIYFYIGKALDENNINYYNSERFEICCEVLAFNLIDKLVYGSLGFFDPPNLNIKKPLNLLFYGGSLNLEELDKLNFTNMNYETREIIILKGVSSTTTTSSPTNYTQVPEDKKAPYFIFKECKTLYPALSDESWDVSFLITAENSAVNILYYEIILDGILVGSNTLDLYIENYNSREISFTLNNITGLKTASSIIIKAEVYTVDGIKVSRGCRSLFSENKSSDSNSSSMTTTTTVSETTSTTILETTGTTILDNVKPEFNKQLTSNNITSTKADLSWQATDNIGILKYVLREGSFIIYEGLKTTKELEGLKPNKSYTFTVDAYDKSGNISSSSVSFDTLEQSSITTTTTIPTTTTTIPTTTTTIPTTTTTTTIPIPTTIYGVHGGERSDSIEGIAVNGNSFYLGGYFGNSIAFHQNSISTSSGTDAFLAKYVQNSGYTWVKTFSNTGTSVIFDVTSKNNYVYITGHFSNTITFGSTTLTSNGSNDIFVVKLSLDGDTQWAKSYGGPHNDSSLSIAIDVNENIYLGGYFNGNNNETITIGNDTYTTSSPTTSSYSDGLIIKLNSSGAFQWSRAFQSTYNTTVNDIAVDQNNNLYVTGPYRGTTDFEGTTLSYVSGNGFFYLAKYDQSGNYQFAKGYGSNGNEQGFGIDINSSGEILVVGSFGNNDVSNYSVDFGNGNLISNGSNDILILKFDSNGNTLNSINFGGSGSEVAREIFVDSSNNIYISGSFSGSFSFGNSITSEGRSDGFIAKLNSNLNPVWIKRAGGASNDIILELEMFNNNIVGVGYVQGSSMNFDGTILSTFGSRDGAVFALDSSGNLK